MKHVAMALAVAYVLWAFQPEPPGKTGAVADALRTATPSDRSKIASFYEALADVTKRDSGTRVANLQMWREAHRDALGLAFGGTDIVGRYKGLDVAIDEALQDAVGLDNVPLSQVSDELSKACREIADSAR